MLCWLPTRQHAVATCRSSRPPLGCPSPRASPASQHDALPAAISCQQSLLSALTFHQSHFHPQLPQFTDIISQSDALRFLHKHQAQLGEALLDATLEQVIALPAGVQSSLG